MSYIVMADPRHGGQPLQSPKPTVVEAIEAAASILAGSDFINVRIEGSGSTLAPAAIQELWRAIHAQGS
jgi:hypothetical protein